MNVHGLGDRSDDDAERGMQAGEATALLCGEKIRVGTLKPLQYVLLCCCPCFLGPPCSRYRRCHKDRVFATYLFFPHFLPSLRSNRRTNYKNMMKTLAFMIVVVCLVMFVVELGVGGGVTTMKENPMLGPDALTLARLGSAYGWRTQTKGEVYRLFSPIFLHGGFFHILANMLFLVFLGVPLEQKWGWRVFGIVFFGSGIAASLFSTCIHPDSISVGASGALFGLLGASLADLLTHWSTIDASARKMQLFQQILTIVIWMMISFGVKASTSPSYLFSFAHSLCFLLVY